MPTRSTVTGFQGAHGAVFTVRRVPRALYRRRVYDRLQLCCSSTWTATSSEPLADANRSSGRPSEIGGLGAVRAQLQMVTRCAGTGPWFGATQLRISNFDDIFLSPSTPTRSRPSPLFGHHDRSRAPPRRPPYETFKPLPTGVLHVAGWSDLQVRFDSSGQPFRRTPRSGRSPRSPRPTVATRRSSWSDTIRDPDTQPNFFGTSAAGATCGVHRSLGPPEERRTRLGQSERDRRRLLSAGSTFAHDLDPMSAQGGEGRRADDHRQRRPGPRATRRAAGADDAGSMRRPELLHACATAGRASLTSHHVRRQPSGRTRTGLWRTGCVVRPAAVRRLPALRRSAPGEQGFPFTVGAPARASTRERSGVVRRPAPARRPSQQYQRMTVSFRAGRAGGRAVRHRSASTATRRVTRLRRRRGRQLGRRARPGRPVPARDDGRRGRVRFTAPHVDAAARSWARSRNRDRLRLDAGRRLRLPRRAGRRGRAR